MIDVPEAFARTTVEREGESGAAWLAELPVTVDGLMERWECAPDGAVLHGGVGVIVPVRRRSGDAAVLKVSFPHPGNVHGPDAFAAWGGRGAVLLHARDDARFAMLLERAHTSTLADANTDADADDAAADLSDEVAAVAGRLSRRLAIPAPPGLPRLRHRAEGWEQELHRDAEELPHRLPAHVVDAAVATVREIGSMQPDVLVHGDLHPRNILRADREPWLAVDPKGYAGDPAYDVGAFLKARAVTFLEADDLEKAVRRTLDVFAEAAELDRERVQRWAQLHLVQASFWGRRQGFRIARNGAPADQLTEYAEHLAVLLTAPA
ncbi:aminoglycoside phosphotransferase family protein [Promicromonospora sukumoe]|uniref:aminoglycoside phosphotransferase family protein n=1 Tax=Promicromonospora sukumoe TaxID=88382 RepID=UPI00037E751E|nr:aminoglycoside phosphotransferase family protein [Promicromonospora sukumoe]